MHDNRAGGFVVSLHPIPILWEGEMNVAGVSEGVSEVFVELGKAGWEQVDVVYWQFSSSPCCPTSPGWVGLWTTRRVYPTLHRALEEVHLQAVTVELAVDVSG